MKRFTKICLIAVLVCVVLGLGFFIGGIAVGGTSSQFMQAIRKGEFSINGFGWSWDSDDEDLDDDGEDEYVFETTGTHHDEDEEHESAHGVAAATGENLDGITKLKVEMEWGTFQVDESEDERIYVEVAGNDTDKVKVYQDGETLTIACKTKTVRNTEVTLYCPADTTFDKVELDVGAGEAVVDVPFQVNDMEVDIGAGRFENSERITAQKSSWEVGAGEIVIDSLDGDKMEFDCGVGTMDILLVGAQGDYDYDTECGLGSLTIGDDEYTGAKEQHITSQNSKGRKIEASCGMGEITIDFE